MLFDLLVQTFGSVQLTYAFIGLCVVSVVVGGYKLLTNLQKNEVTKFGLLGVIFGLIIGLYWALRPIKDSIFSSVVGIEYQPVAKWVSLCLIVPLILLYGKLIDMFPRHKVFYALTLFYAVAALGFSWAFNHPTMGLANTVADSSRYIGWAWYVFVESFGSLCVALFWAITTDITTEDSAKRGFPVIAMLGQMGNIFGPYFLRAEALGYEHSGPMVALVGYGLVVVCALMWVFNKVVPASEMVGYQQEHHLDKSAEKEPGFFEGLKLLITQPYLLGIFVIITVFETIVTIFDFYFKYTAKQAFPMEKALADYLADYAVMTGIVATLCVLWGINSIQQRLGMFASLVMMPIVVAFAIVGLKFSPTLTVAFWIMVSAKAVNYALNQPTLKQLYIPTTKETKYKSQAWIEMFGSRGSKAMGSGINMFMKTFKNSYGPAAGVSMFLTMSSAVSLGLVAVWFFVVLFVAKTYNQAIKEERVVC